MPILTLPSTSAFRLGSDGTDRQNDGVGVTQLTALTVPANNLVVNGAIVWYQGSLNFVTANNKTLTVRLFDGATSTDLALEAGTVGTGIYIVNATVFRQNDTTVDFVAWGARNGGANQVLASYALAVASLASNALIISCRANGTAAGDVIQHNAILFIIK